jgi:hypothetical protein
MLLLEYGRPKRDYPVRAMVSDFSNRGEITKCLQWRTRRKASQGLGIKVALKVKPSLIWRDHSERYLEVCSMHKWSGVSSRSTISDAATDIQV